MGQRRRPRRRAPLGSPSLTAPDLGRLAAVAAEVAHEWSIELGPPFALTRHSFVAPVGSDAVLKITPVEDDEGDEEPGDFHHHNLLASRGRWVAIDPKPMLGEPEYDVYSFLVNPLGSQMQLDRTERRLAAFAGAGLDESRMRAWALIRGAYLCTDTRRLEVLRALV